jgi:hypothetical protein
VKSWRGGELKLKCETATMCDTNRRLVIVAVGDGCGMMFLEEVSISSGRNY